MSRKMPIISVLGSLLVFTTILNTLLLFYYICGFIFEKLNPISIKSIDSSKNLIKNASKMYDITEFKYLITKPECSRNSSAPYFVTLVHSSPTQFRRRAACRDTWAHSDPRTITYFLMGMVESLGIQSKIDAEESQFHDIIQGNFIDSYHNLTYKHTMALKWFTDNCPHVKYLLKLDDDVFVNVPATYEYLRDNKNDRQFILGIYFPPLLTSRKGKWKTSVEDIRERFTPEYASGQSVIYSSDFVREAYEKTSTTRYLWIDDLLISGYIRMQLNVRIEPIHPLRLSDDALRMVLNGTNTTLPDPKFIASEHDRKYNDMIKLWNITESYRKGHHP